MRRLIATVFNYSLHPFAGILNAGRADLLLDNRP